MSTLNAAQIATYAAHAGFTGNALITATAIALAESSGRTDVVNSLGCVGLWQVYQKMHPEYSTASLMDPATNAAAAYKISNGGTNFKPWETYTNGMYIAQLGQARLGAGAVTQGTAAGGSAVVPANFLTDLGSAITSPLSAVGGAVTGTVDGLASIGTLGISAASWISNGHNWVRITEVIAGGAAILVGLKMLADSGIDSPVTDIAASADKTVKAATDKAIEIGKAS